MRGAARVEVAACLHPRLLFSLQTMYSRVPLLRAQEGQKKCAHSGGLRGARLLRGRRRGSCSCSCGACSSLPGPQLDSVLGEYALLAAIAAALVRGGHLRARQGGRGRRCSARDRARNRARAHACAKVATCPMHYAQSKECKHRHLFICERWATGHRLQRRKKKKEDATALVRLGSTSSPVVTVTVTRGAAAVPQRPHWPLA